MASWGARIPHLDARNHLFIALNTSAVDNSTLQTHSQNSSSWDSKATEALIAQLQLAQVQSVRTANIILGAFSLALALVTVHRIVSDARRAASLQVLPRKQRFAFLHNVHTAETFPLALACSAVLQLIFIIAAQSTTLYTIYSTQGKIMAMLTLPTIFLVGYTTLVFGIEMALRAVTREKFAPRGKWNTTICLGVVSLLVILTWIPTVAFPSFTRCFGGLIFFSATKYDFLSLIIASVIVSLFLFLAALIGVQLMRTSEVDPNERISASRMTYFLLVAAVLYALVIPVEVLSLQKKFMSSLSTAVVAEGSLFSVGIVISFAHLFLRANATRMVIRPMNEMKAKTKPARPRIRLFGPSDLQMNISRPMAFQTSRRPESRQGLIDVGLEKNQFDFEPGYFERAERVRTPTSANSLGSIDPTKWPLPPDDDEKNIGHYSLFPTRAEDVPRLPATVYTPNAAEDGSRGSKLGIRRFTSRSSITNISDFFTKSRRSDSIATVQIGLRFSLGPAVVAIPKGAQPESILPPPLGRNETESSGESLGLPIQSPLARKNSGAYLQAQRERLLPSPLFSKSASPTPRSATPSRPFVSEPFVPEVLAPESLAPAPTVLPVLLRMSPLAANPPTPAGSPVLSRPGTPGSIISVASITPSPNARIPLGAGTMPRGVPRK